MPVHHDSVPVIGTLGKDDVGISDALRVSVAHYGLASLDCAPRYENLNEVGKAIRQVSLERWRLRITSKINAIRQERSTVRRSVLDDLERIGVTKLDCYLIHSPRYSGFPQTWQGMQEARGEGLIEEIGVANFGLGELSELSFPHPTVLQVSAPQYYMGECPQPSKTLRIELYGVVSFFLRLPPESKREFSSLCSELNLADDEGLMISSAYEGVVPVLGTSRADRLERQFQAYDYGIKKPDYAAALSKCLRRLYA